ncbi:MAG: DUF1080 domain-containing protein [Bacteroidales bacterium]
MRSVIVNLFIIIAFFGLASCQESLTTNEPEPPVKTDISEFIGHWSFDIDGGFVGWLGVTREDGYLDAELLWKWGSVTPVSNVFLANGNTLYVTRTGNLMRSPASEGDAPRIHVATSWMEAKTDGENISGYFLEPRADGTGVDSTWFEGIKLPDVPPAPDLTALNFGEPLNLFNGTDLSGWKLTNESQVNGFKVVDGVLFNDVARKPGEPRVNYGNLQTVEEFGDFNLKLEVNLPAGSNSGVYLRGMYEIQVVDSYGRELDSHNMGGLYSRVAPSVNAEKPAGQWQSMDITLVDRHVTVLLNDVKILDNVPVYGPTGGALTSDVFAPGPIYLQGDHGVVSYRNIVLTPIINQ